MLGRYFPKMYCPGFAYIRRCWFFPQLHIMFSLTLWHSGWGKSGGMVYNQDSKRVALKNNGPFQPLNFVRLGIKMVLIYLHVNALNSRWGVEGGTQSWALCLKYTDLGKSYWVRKSTSRIPDGQQAEIILLLSARTQNKWQVKLKLTTQNSSSQQPSIPVKKKTEKDPNVWRKTM